MANRVFLMFKKIKKYIKESDGAFVWFVKWFSVYALIWVLSGFFMQLMISNRIKDDGEYTTWFGDRIIVKQDVFINNKQKEK
jgi:hypothetical protein